MIQDTKNNVTQHNICNRIIPVTGYFSPSLIHCLDASPLRRVAASLLRRFAASLTLRLFTASPLSHSIFFFVVLLFRASFTLLIVL
jgi:hypothetical protein